MQSFVRRFGLLALVAVSCLGLLGLVSASQRYGTGVEAASNHGPSRNLSQPH